MSFKEHLLKKVMPTYFMIVTLLNIGMLIIGEIFFKEESFGYEVFFSPLYFGLIGCVVPIMDYLLQVKSANKVAIVAQTALKLVVIEVCVLVAAYIIGLMDSLLITLIIACMVLAIFVIVCVIHYLQDQAFCKDMNKALLEYKSLKQDDVQ